MHGMKRVLFSFGLALTALLSPPCAGQRDVAGAAADEALAPVIAGRTTVAWTPANGFSLAVDDVPVVRTSTLFLVKAGWSGVLFDQTKVKPVITGWAAGANGARTAQAVLENENARCAYVFTVAPDGSKVTVDLGYRLKANTPAAIEYGAGYLSGAVLQGAARSGTAASGGATKTGTVRVAPPPAGTEQEAARLLPDPFQTLDFDTRLGKISIAYSGDAPPPVIFDARAETQAWATEFPTFWMGIGSPEQPVSVADGERHAVWTYTIGTAPPRAALPADGPVADAVSPVPNAYAPYLPPNGPLVLPRPKSLVRGAGKPFRLGARTLIVVGEKANEAEMRPARLLATEIRARFGKTVPIARAGDAKAQATLKPGGGPLTLLVIGEPARNFYLEMMLPLSGGVAPPAHPEGYGVSVTPNAVLIAGTDRSGTIWGAQTVIQLLEADTTGPLIRPVRIYDWPTLSLRAAHLFHGKNALPFHEKLINRVLSRFKMNAVFIQAEQLRWDADPEVAPSWAGTKADIKTEVAYARERGITLYPLVQSYGHMEWLFSRERNRAFAEDPETPYALNITNPDAVAYLQKFNREADDLFGAPGFHAGLDEVTMRGRFPFRSKGRTFSDLYVANATYCHDFFTQRDKTLWMWADMALHPSEVAPCFGTAPSPADAAKVRAGLPKDVVMCDWQYGTQTRFPSLDLLKKAGFTKRVAATWFNPANIQNFSRAAARNGAMGAMQTTWAGYESSEAVLETDQRKQFTAMVLAADYFWNGGAGPAPDKLPYDAGAVFAKQWAAVNPSDAHVREGALVNLSPVANAALPDWLGYGSVNGPALFPTGDTRLPDGVLYRFGKPGRAVLLAGKLNPPAAAPLRAITFNPPAPPASGGDGARTLRLALAASHRAPMGTIIGEARLLRIGDGSVIQSVPLVYGKNIASWDDPNALPPAPTLWRGVTGAKQGFVLRGLAIPVGDAQSGTRVEITSANGASAPVVFAATWEEDAN